MNDHVPAHRTPDPAPLARHRRRRPVRVRTRPAPDGRTSVEESTDVIRTVFNRPEVYALQSREDGRAIGYVGILIGADSNFEIGEREGEIAYWIGVPYWRRGLVPEAVREVMRHAFLDLRLDALWCGYFADNLQSLNAQSKCGFQHHHTEVNKFNSFLGDYHTEHISCITRDQWQAQQASVLRA
ncbi:GNAT family N-acetyltransferase [Stenotrophomonas sp. GD03777]|nr:MULTISPECIES: GNAT family N-acetyltransferase [Stenotrophomonas]MDH1661056.1 GNAT family N-acetyltransferase [Stenotrophomonas sp. GD03777]